MLKLKVSKMEELRQIKESLENHIYSREGLVNMCKRFLSSPSDEGKRFRLLFLNTIINAKRNQGSPTKGLGSSFRQIDNILKGKAGDNIILSNDEDSLLIEKLPRYINQYLDIAMENKKIVPVGNGLFSTRGEQDINKTYFSFDGLVNLIRNEILTDRGKLLMYFKLIFSKQTEDEIGGKTTLYNNKIGLQVPDAKRFTPDYKNLVDYDLLPSEERWLDIRDMMQKYATQIVRIFLDEGSLEEVEDGIYIFGEG